MVVFGSSLPSSTRKKSLSSIYLYCRRPHGHFGKVTARRAVKKKEKEKKMTVWLYTDDRLKTRSKIEGENKNNSLGLISI